MSRLLATTDFAPPGPRSLATVVSRWRAACQIAYAAAARSKMASVTLVKHPHALQPRHVKGSWPDAQCDVLADKRS